MSMIRPANSAFRCSVVAALAINFLLTPALVVARDCPKPPAKPLHYAPNANFDSNGKYLPSQAGFGMADVNSVSQLDALGRDVKGLVWVGQCNGADEKFRKTVQPYIGNPKLYGFYLMDDPDPRRMLQSGKLSVSCTPDNLKAESDWIHRHAPGAKTFIVPMNLSSSKTPSFKNTYNPTNSHVDLFGIDPYPCRTELNGCDYDMIDRYVLAAEAWGIPRSRMVPVYQSFGGGEWLDDNDGRYLLPTAEQTRQMLARWRKYVTAPEFDVVYSWGSQRSDAALEGAPDLQEVFSVHNHASGPLAKPNCHDVEMVPLDAANPPAQQAAVPSRDRSRNSPGQPPS